MPAVPVFAGLRRNRYTLSAARRLPEGRGARSPRNARGCSRPNSRAAALVRRSASPLAVACYRSRATSGQAGLHRRDSGDGRGKTGLITRAPANSWIRQSARRSPETRRPVAGFSPEYAALPFTGARQGAGSGRDCQVGSGPASRRGQRQRVLLAQQRVPGVLPQLLPAMHDTLSPTRIPLIPALPNWRERAPPTPWSP